MERQNPNAAWLSQRGIWVTSLVLVIFLKLTFSANIVGVEASWTLTTVVFNVVCWVFFHRIKGVPFDDAGIQGEYACLTLWEQLEAAEEEGPIGLRTKKKRVICGSPQLSPREIPDSVIGGTRRSAIKAARTKRFLIVLPIALFLLSAHNSRYGMLAFALNFTSTLLVLLPKIYNSKLVS
ncbi:hypothetical protein DI09_171p60 [Mitosporidium daphniae]|uniref:Uncharacterized protein n=1 Tax=Mitosporidium daphniae TaxID=1485682 RepID=A0A098VU28_9MICR|nr:uncharacterized protein DI09_64p100 [Mitosporidium daphniae]XP_013238876.1 uncharacterized protein DI09_171p60 [Mitosporidium daphniae]KGG50574.1 hypothetical protein DI09_64p100 [Mitosporidium daphniae]KGG52440.1 hypothetical protein DI09_171p60 [Mitosporidium daphniae]|eukprot:XP_013237001.1 uncharacterized protein DI09_64p100 [Mitosporidium daphniae]